MQGVRNDIYGGKTIEEWIDDLNASQEETRHQAMATLEAVGRDADKAVPKLTALVLDKAQGIQLREHAARVLGHIGTPAKEERAKIIAAMRASTDAWLRSSIVHSLGHWHEVDELTTRLDQQKEPKSIVRVEAARVLGQFNATSRDAIEPLRQALTRDSEGQVRYVCALALGRFGPPAAIAIPDLMNVLKNDQQIGARIGAAVGLSRFGNEGKDAIPQIIQYLREYRQVGYRVQLVDALGGFGSAATTAAPELIAILKYERDPRLRQSSIRALAISGADTKDALPLFMRILAGEEQFEVRTEAMGAIGLVGSDSPDVATGLIKVAKEDKEANVRATAYRTLGNLGSAAALKPLTEAALHDPSLVVRVAATRSLLTLSVLLQARETKPKELDEVLKFLDTEGNVPADADNGSQIRDALRRAAESLDDKERQRLRNQLWEWLKKNWWLPSLLAYPAMLCGLWSVVLWKRPLWLLVINDELRPYADITLPSWLLGLKVPLRKVLLVQYFNYPPRVLDAWVKKRADQARIAFECLPTVTQRRIYVSQAVTVDGRLVPTLTPEDLRLAWKQAVLPFLVLGEGGSGKTSLACQIARWALTAGSDDQLQPYIMLPVLVEQPVAGTSLLTIIRNRLDAYDPGALLASDELLGHLLRTGRILLIVDGFSEMDEASRSVVLPPAPEVRAKALIVTARSAHGLESVSGYKFEPQRIERKRLATFLGSYLSRVNKGTLFTDREFFDVCARMSEIVGSRDIPVLLAKLIIDLAIGQKENPSSGSPLRSILDIMVGYVYLLDHTSPATIPSTPTLLPDAECIAWECIRGHFRPEPVSVARLLVALGEPDANKRLQVLQERLGLVQMVEFARDFVHFVLDPLAEYLASLHIVRHLGHNAVEWRKFLKGLPVPPLPASSNGFVAALLDCVRTKQTDEKIPGFVIDRLQRLLDTTSGRAPLVATPAGDEPTPTGTWKYLAEANGQSIEVTIKLMLEGQNLTGTVSTLDVESEIEGAEYRDGEASFSVNHEVNGSKSTLKYKVKITGDTLKGQLNVERDGQICTSEFQAKRSEE
jgi:HEAT repeat protein